MHVAAYIRALGRDFEKPTVKQHLAAIRMMFDWLVVGQVVAINPAHSVRGPKHAVKRGKTPVLTPDEARKLLDSIDVTTLVGLRDRALIGMMAYSFARVSAAVSMRVRIILVKGSAGGYACMRKAARSTKCPATTIWKPILTLIWRRPAFSTPRSLPFPLSSRSHRRAERKHDDAGRCVADDPPAFERRRA